MHDEPSDSPLFGEPFLWAALFRRATEAGSTVV
ncbi:SAM-dependent methyltransferase [Streptomyces hygroscopicus]|nr:SAM-dependent methyltransferase [Streptomyces hygroscopicus]